MGQELSLQCGSRDSVAFTGSSSIMIKEYLFITHGHSWAANFREAKMAVPAAIPLTASILFLILFGEQGSAWALGSQFTGTVEL